MAVALDPDLRRNGRQRRATNTRNICKLVGLVGAVLLVATFGYELLTVLEIHYKPQSAANYSGEFDWGDMEAYAIGMLPYLGAIKLIQNRTTQQTT